MLARAVACESRLNFINIKGSELISMYVGESEKAVREAFNRARQVAPAVVFIDELDGLVGTRGSGGGGSSGTSSSNDLGARLLAQLLQELDGAKGLHDVVVIGATNRPHAIDPALLRPGRFDRLIYVPPPDAAARLSILRLHTRDIPLGPDVDLAQVASELIDIQGFSGAGVAGFVHRAALHAIEEDVMKCDSVCLRHFELAARGAKASVDESLVRIYEQFEGSRRRM